MPILPLLSLALHCWKPIPMMNHSRYWVDVVPVEGRTDVMELRYGTGLEDGMLEVDFVDAVLPPVNGETRNAPTSDFDLSFSRTKSGRYDLIVRDRSSGRSSKVRNFRCD
jgi:hypothetical protein